MTDSNAPRSAPEVAPNLVGNWTLAVEGEIAPSAKDLICINIYFQIQGQADSPLYGSVDSKGPAISKFALENGTLTRNVIVQFDVTMSGQIYQFNGTVKDPQLMEGTITLLLAAPGSPTEEGSWSAQAQGGGEE